MKKICFVNGSPRSKNSCSQYIIDLLKELLDSNAMQPDDVYIAGCIKSNQEAGAFRKMADADSIIFAFPLYIDSIPSHMLSFLHQFDHYLKNDGFTNGKKGPDVYAIINNGFIEGQQNKNAARIMQHFTSSVGFNWRFAVGVGAGEFMRESKQDIPIQSKMKKKVYRAFMKLKKDIESNEVSCEKNIFSNPVMPRTLFMFAAGRHWVRLGKKNNLKKKELYSRPW